MSRDENEPSLPPRIRAVFDFLYHTRMVTEQVDAAIPVRELTPLERNVEAAALRALQQYFLGEMDFAEEPEPSVEKGKGDDAASAPVSSAR